MDGQTLKQKPSMKCETKEASPKPWRNTSSKSSTCSMDSHTSSSGSEFGSYCEITNIKSKQLSLVERQNSQNEEKEGLLGAQTQNETQNTQTFSPVHRLQSCVNQNYKSDKEHVVDLDKVIYEQIDTKKPSSKSDTDWTVLDTSRTKKSKSKCARTCAGCCCTVTLSTFFSVVISVSLIFLFLRYSNEPAMVRYHPEGTAQVPKTGQVKQFHSLNDT